MSTIGFALFAILVLLFNLLDFHESIFREGGRITKAVKADQIKAKIEEFKDIQKRYIPMQWKQDYTQSWIPTNNKITEKCSTEQWKGSVITGLTLLPAFNSKVRESQDNLKFTKSCGPK